jgi:hypothetical protein
VDTEIPEQPTFVQRARQNYYCYQTQVQLLIPQQASEIKRQGSETRKVIICKAGYMRRWRILVQSPSLLEADLEVVYIGGECVIADCWVSFKSKKVNHKTNSITWSIKK